MDRGERGMNPVAMTVINPPKEYWLTRGSNQEPPVLKSATLPMSYGGLAKIILKTILSLILDLQSNTTPDLEYNTTSD